jgi:ribosomal-protein-alanine N-acetyltransferase
MKTPILQTERLTLRPVTLADAPAVQKYFNDWEIIRHLSLMVPWPYPDDGAEIFLAKALLRMKEEGHHVWAITLKKPGPGEAIGLVDFGIGRETDDRGFWLARPFQGKGYMTEAITAVQDYLFFEEGLERFYVRNAKSNSGSRRVKEKTGAVFLRIIEFPHHDGDTQSEVWEVTRENWAKLRNRS